MMINWEKIKKVHLVGIGGVGISALARLLLSQGKLISGTEDNPSPETLDPLRQAGVIVSLDLDPQNLPAADCYIYSDAWLTKNPALLGAAKERGVPCLSYYEALGQIANSSPCLIAVAGTHGKTTTTAMLLDIFESAGLKPCGVVGSLRSKTKNNFCAGETTYFISEADEYRRHFLQFQPKVVVITNIEADHLDYYRDLADIQSAFIELVRKLPPDGLLVADVDDPNLKPVIAASSARVINYRLVTKEFKLRLPGAHNIKNAQAALAVAEGLGIPFVAARSAVENFAGTWRRFEYKGLMTTGAMVYDDYGHHPTEIAATIAGAREVYPNKKLTIIFQPHLYSRTKLLLADFAQALAQADRVIITPIYAAREPVDPNVSGEQLAQAVAQLNPRVLFLANFEAVKAELLRETTNQDVILVSGAGDISKLAGDLV